MDRADFVYEQVIEWNKAENEGKAFTVDKDFL